MANPYPLARTIARWKPAVGSKVAVSIVNENEYGRLRPGHYLGANGEPCPILNESIVHNIGDLVDNTLDGSRGVPDTRRGASDVSGDLNINLRPQGYEQLIKFACGEGADGSSVYIKIPHARGDTALQVNGLNPVTALTADTRFTAAQVADLLWLRGERSLVQAWYEDMGDSWQNPLGVAPTVASDDFYAVHVGRNAAGNLTQTWWHFDQFVVFDSLDPATSNGGAGLAGANGDETDPAWYQCLWGDALASRTVAARDGEWCFLACDSVGDGSGTSYVYGDAVIHYMELGADLADVGLNVDIMRDILLFVYTGMKVNTWTMTFTNQEIINATFGLMGKTEYIGGYLTAEAQNGAVAIVVDDTRIFQNHSTLVPTEPQLVLGAVREINYTQLNTAALDTDAGMTAPQPATVTVAALAGGTDPTGTPAGAPSIWAGTSTDYGFGVNTPVGLSSTRANDSTAPFPGVGNPVDLQDNIPDVPSFSYFEGHAEMWHGMTNQAGGVFDGWAKGPEHVDIMSATWTVNNNIYGEKYELGSRDRIMTFGQRRTVEGSLSVEFDNLIQYRKYVDGTEFSFVIRCISEDTSRGLISNVRTAIPYSTCFYLRRCKYTGGTPNASDESLIVADMPFRAHNYVGDSSNKPFTEVCVWFTNKRSGDLWT